MRKIYLIIFYLGFLFLTYCSSNGGGNHQSETSNIDQLETRGEYNVDPSFKKQWSAFITSYLTLKDSLMISKKERVSELAEIALLTFNSIEIPNLQELAHQEWDSLNRALKNSLEEIMNGQDLDAQRLAFASLTQNLHHGIQSFGRGEQALYYQFCPMALKNKGAYWISDQKTIRNPYFGKKMLTCGEVKETL